MQHDELTSTEQASISDARRLRRSRHRRRRMRRPVSAVPSLLTLGNLIAGFAAIHYATQPAEAVGPWAWSGLTFAGALVLLGIILDAVDGSVARLTRSFTATGAELDSLADVVTFGVAPAFMTLQLVGEYYEIVAQTEVGVVGKVVWACVVGYVCCAALRLARFNADLKSGHGDDHKTFHGLPSPGAAGTVAGMILVHQHYLATPVDIALSQQVIKAIPVGIAIVTALCAVGMVAPIRYPHFMNQYLRSHMSFRYMIYLVVALVMAVTFFHLTVFALFTAYALSGPFGILWRRLRSDSARQAFTAVSQE